MELAERIRLARDRAEMTQKQLAKRLRIGQSAISQWESGATTPDVGNLIKLSVVLRTSVSELLPDTHQGPEALLKLPGAQQLLQRYAQLTPELREAILAAAASMAETLRTSR